MSRGAYVAWLSETGMRRVRRRPLQRSLHHPRADDLPTRRRHPYARKDPNRDTGWVHYAGSTSCTRLDPKLSYQDALLYLVEDNGSVNTTTLATTRNQRTTRIDLQKSVRAPAVELRAEFVIQLHGSLMFVSYPGCSRQSASMISCRWTSAPYDTS
jgi:hypothetical protein